MFNLNYKDIMKDLNIKLSDLNGQELTDREKSSFRGGDAEPNCCQCGCCYEGEPEGSDKETNLDVNYESYLYSLCPPQSPSSCAIQSLGGVQYSWDHCNIIV